MDPVYSRPLPAATSKPSTCLAYAPELNSVEYLWGHWKHRELPNVCPKDHWELDARPRQASRRMRKPRLVAAFWKQSFLSLDQLNIMRDSVRQNSVTPTIYAKGVLRRSIEATRNGKCERFFTQLLTSAPAPTESFLTGSICISDQFPECRAFHQASAEVDSPP